MYFIIVLAPILGVPYLSGTNITDFLKRINAYFNKLNILDNNKASYILDYYLVKIRIKIKNTFKYYSRN